MFKFTVQHKYCSMIKQVEGVNVWDAFKSEGLDFNIWICKEVKPIA